MKSLPTITLARPAFVFALALLLANDLVLKSAYPGWLTGKLSDFAGLFVLPYFLAWLWPARRGALHIGVVLAFVAWKLPLSRPFVEQWNAAPWFDIARVEDLTDLVALPCVALSYRTTTTAARRVVHVPNVVVAGIALLAFAATSQPPDRAVLTGTYYFIGTPTELERRLEDANLGVASIVSTNGAPRENEATRWGDWIVSVPHERGRACLGLSYDFDVAQAGDPLVIELRGAMAHCRLEGANLQLAVREFNARVAQPGGLRPLRRLPGPTHAPAEFACEPVADAPTFEPPLPCPHPSPAPPSAPPIEPDPT